MIVIIKWALSKVFDSTSGIILARNLEHILCKILARFPLAIVILSPNDRLCRG